jgi:hypothetical protein
VRDVEVVPHFAFLSEIRARGPELLDDEPVALGRILDDAGVVVTAFDEIA